MTFLETTQRLNKFLCIAASVLAFSIAAFSQNGGRISGAVLFGGNAKPLSGASVKIVQLNRSVATRDDGTYEFTGLPAGRYTVVAHFGGFEDTARTVTVAAGGREVADLTLQLTGVREQVTVTA